MVLLHIVGVGASLQLGRFILDFERGACRLLRGTGAQAHVSAQKDIVMQICVCLFGQKHALARQSHVGGGRPHAQNEPPARQTAPMIHGIQLWLCFGHLFVRFQSGICRLVLEKRADVLSLSAALTGGRNDSLAV